METSLNKLYVLYSSYNMIEAKEEYARTCHFLCTNAHPCSLWSTAYLCPACHKLLASYSCHRKQHVPAAITPLVPHEDLCTGRCAWPPLLPVLLETLDDDAILLLLAEVSPLASSPSVKSSSSCASSLVQRRLLAA
ncbi:hypothetical protein Vretimale_1353 [Volvox reticuliferus]|uniref:Uncharacterized protein n=1 Tax=Volvox reticuliferus TaxID=1737510 RepID=A0A8J4CH45_9CHLO|nr:hypothetical protein Vretifemale_10728 [Volvox reticuliferus]GIL95276.1 hypothetical protein Vretimale_1353 [Volvox reticuliferus]